MMKTKRQFIFLLFLLLCLANMHVMAAQTPPVKARKSRLVISFVSICCGIDHKAQDRVDEFIARYEKARHLSLTKKKVYWGKEGEFDYCFSLTKLSARKQKRLVADLKTLVKGTELVHIMENIPCKAGRTN